ncbi:hypothetical protein NECAME_01017 [Necator americanus]|uniref:CAAX prenyl protease 1 N-terminal domain-containing protein n=1 Tax=Necator americanus TaxID=51031 RepID=W2SK77_NECAM|nr:hypothetical protein NECAME_01017 [Necator americanus]ETN70069.1 hypothetical protein NECAME_01017 [Necator americanus]
MSLLAALLGSSWAAFLWKSYLRYRQYNVQLLNEKRPREAEELITDEDYHRARDYNLDKHKYWFAYNAFNQIWTTLKYFVLYTAVYGGLLAVTEFTIEKGGVADCTVPKELE